MYIYIYIYIYIGQPAGDARHRQLPCPRLGGRYTPNLPTEMIAASTKIA